MQTLKNIKPVSVNTDADELLLKADEARYIKNYRIVFNQNAGLATATGQTPSGANMGVQTPLPSNRKLQGLTLPAGFNKCVGAFESVDTNELYHLNYNSNKLHGIYRINGDTLRWEIVAIDPKLAFSIDPRHAIPSHTASLKIVYYTDSNGVKQIKEKYFVYTDSKNWQRWINVEACIATNTFDPGAYPYWEVKQPHFDRAEFFEWPVRPPMMCPLIRPLPLTETDKGKDNYFLNKSKQYAYRYILTDGRASTLSPYSLPYFLTKNTCNINSANLSRCIELTLYAGSALVEAIELLERDCGGDWYKVDTIKRFSSCDQNDPAIIGNNYWLRTKPWEDFSYDPVFNTIKYKHCGDKGKKLFSQADANRFQNDIPIQSVALTPAGDAELLSHNLLDYDNLPCETLNKFSLNTITDDTAEQCSVIPRKITLYAYIGRNAEDSQPLWYNGSDTIVRFGGVWLKPTFTPPVTVDYNIEVDNDDPNTFGSNFGDKKSFICYLAGTKYYTIGKQYKVNPDGSRELTPEFDLSRTDQKDLVQAHLRAGGYFIVQFEFNNIPSGKYIARLARHDASESSDFQESSTWVMGIADHMLKVPGKPVINRAAIKSYSKEIEIDCCNSDVDVWNNGRDLFYIFCPYQYDGDGGILANRRWRFIEGYVQEDSTDKVGVELLRIDTSHGFAEYKRDGYFTDHNGHYFAYTARGDAKSAVVDFRGKFNCVNDGSILFSNRDLPAKDRGYYLGENIFVNEKNGGQFGKCNRILVRGKISNCDNTAGVAGVSITITRGGTAYSKDDGTFELIVHNSFETIRVDRMYFNASGECVLTSCSCACNEILPYDDGSVVCVSCIERIYPLNIVRNYRVSNKVLTSLKGGGRYGICGAGIDLAGRATYLQLLGYLNTPSFLEVGRFVPTSAGWGLQGPLKLPPELKWFSFFISKNLNLKSYLQWVGDKIEYLNNDGEVVANPGLAVRARITIQSLNDFNKEHTFATTTKYQFVDGDRVRIYDNGDGVLFNPLNTNGFLDYEILGTNWNDETTSQVSTSTDTLTGSTTTTKVVTDGKSFIIPYDSRLDALKDKCGFWIEIIRPSESNDTEVFCEVCGTYPVINGEIAIFKGFDNNHQPLYDFPLSGSLAAWDTYYHSRFFRIANCGGKSFSHPFESLAIADTWGDGCNSCGRKHVRNEYAAQRWYVHDTIRSDNFVNEGGYNGLGTFRIENRKRFKGQESGAIIATHAERNIIAFICTNDWFVADIDLNIVRATKDGLYVQNLDNSLGDPHQKIGKAFGCDLEDKSALLFEDNLCLYADKKGSGIIAMSYTDAYDIAAIDNKSYFENKFRLITAHNQSLSVDRYLEDYIDTIFGFDPQANELNVTFRPRRGLTDNMQSFISDEREVKYDHQETFIFNLDMKKWVRYTGYAPEYYGKLKNSIGMQMVAFAKGEPYSHAITPSGSYNTFFGIKTQRIIAGVVNDFPSKEKVFLSMAVESNEHLHFADKIETDAVNSLSYIPPAYWKRKGNVWYAEILRNMNTYPPADVKEAYRKMLMDGKSVRGLFMNFRLVGDPERLDEYSELNNIWTRIIGSEQSQK